MQVEFQTLVVSDILQVGVTMRSLWCLIAQFWFYSSAGRIIQHAFSENEVDRTFGLSESEMAGSISFSVQCCSQHPGWIALILFGHPKDYEILIGPTQDPISKHTIRLVKTFSCFLSLWFGWIEPEMKSLWAANDWHDHKQTHKSTHKVPQVWRIWIQVSWMYPKLWKDLRSKRFCRSQKTPSRDHFSLFNYTLYFQKKTCFVNKLLLFTVLWPWSGQMFSNIKSNNREACLTNPRFVLCSGITFHNLPLDNFKLCHVSLILLAAYCAELSWYTKCSI